MKPHHANWMLVRIMTWVCILAALGGRHAAAQDQSVLHDLPGGSQGAGDGDLWFSYRCENELDYYNPDYFIMLEQRVEARVDGVLFAAAENQGYNYLYTAVEFEVPAAPQNRSITCTAMTGSSDASTLAGSGPPILNFLVDAFIPHEYVWQPWDPFNPNFYLLTLVDQGDNRSFQHAGATARASTVFDLRNPAYFGDLYQRAPSSATGLTQAYDANTSLSYPQGLDWTGAPSGGYLFQSAKDDWQPLAPMKVMWGTAHTNYMHCGQPQRLYRQFGEDTSSVHIECTAEAYHPFHSTAFPIRWDLSLRFTFGNNRMQYSIEGCTGYFPAFEAYANGTRVLEIPPGMHPIQLVFGCNRSVASNGEVW